MTFVLASLLYSPMAKHFGTYVVQDLCKGFLTLPVLVRAMGMHLGDFEREVLLTGTTLSATIKRLSEVMEHAWTLDAPTPTYEGILRVEVDWNIGPKEEFCGGIWIEPEVLTDVDPNYNGGAWTTWIKSCPRFTLQAAVKTLMPGKHLATPELLAGLKALRYRPNQEAVGGQQMQVWCWNPLDVQRPASRPPARIYAPKPPAPPPLFRPLSDRVKEYLQRIRQAGTTQVTATQVAMALLGQVPKSAGTQQRIRDYIGYYGWEYNHTKKAWVAGPKAV